MGDSDSDVAEPRRAGRIYRRHDHALVGPKPVQDGVTSDLVHYAVIPTTGAVVTSRLWDQLSSQKDDLATWMRLGGFTRIGELECRAASAEDLRHASAAILADWAKRFGLDFRWIAEDAKTSIRCVPTEGPGVQNVCDWLYRRFAVVDLDANCVLCPPELGRGACNLDVCPLLFAVNVRQTETGWPSDCARGPFPPKAFPFLCAWFNLHTIAVVCRFLDLDAYNFWRSLQTAREKLMPPRFDAWFDGEM